MSYVDLAFKLTGSKVPVDHGYALYSAISRILPEIHGAKNYWCASYPGHIRREWRIDTPRNSLRLGRQSACPSL
jgi:hypothetical protein